MLNPPLALNRPRHVTQGCLLKLFVKLHQLSRDAVLSGSIGATAWQFADASWLDVRWMTGLKIRAMQQSRLTTANGALSVHATSA